MLLLQFCDIISESQMMSAAVCNSWCFYLQAGESVVCQRHIRVWLREKTRCLSHLSSSTCRDVFRVSLQRLTCLTCLCSHSAVFVSLVWFICTKYNQHINYNLLLYYLLHIKMRLYWSPGGNSQLEAWKFKLTCCSTQLWWFRMWLMVLVCL